jgi:hypothetical protein
MTSLWKFAECSWELEIYLYNMSRGRLSEQAMTMAYPKLQRFLNIEITSKILSTTFLLYSNSALLSSIGIVLVFVCSSRYFVCSQIVVEPEAIAEIMRHP